MWYLSRKVRTKCRAIVLDLSFCHILRVCSCLCDGIANFTVWLSRKVQAHAWQALNGFHRPKMHLFVLHSLFGIATYAQGELAALSSWHGTDIHLSLEGI
jgi:hypothetical protein